MDTRTAALGGTIGGTSQSRKKRAAALTHVIQANAARRTRGGRA